MDHFIYPSCHKVAHPTWKCNSSATFDTISINNTFTALIWGEYQQTLMDDELLKRPSAVRRRYYRLQLPLIRLETDWET